MDSLPTEMHHMVLDRLSPSDWRAYAQAGSPAMRRAVGSYTVSPENFSPVQLTAALANRDLLATRAMLAHNSSVVDQDLYRSAHPDAALLLFEHGVAPQETHLLEHVRKGHAAVVAAFLRKPHLQRVAQGWDYRKLTEIPDLATLKALLDAGYLRDGLNRRQSNWAVCSDVPHVRAHAIELQRRRLLAPAAWHELRLAYCDRDGTLLQRYITMGAVDIHERDRRGRSILHDSPSHLQTVALAHGADPNARDNAKRSPLHTSRSPETMRALLDAGADPNATDRYGNTPLHNAWSDETVELLVAAGANMDTPNRQGLVPLVTAAPGAVQALLNLGADMAHIKRLPKFVYGQDFNILLSNGLDPNLHDVKGRTLLHKAADRIDPRTVQLLLDYGADPSIADADGETPLHVAAENTRSAPAWMRPAARTIFDKLTRAPEGEVALAMRNKDGRTPIDLLGSAY